MEFKPFPTFRWHPVHGKKLVQSALELAGLGEGWVDSPAKLTAAAPSPATPANPPSASNGAGSSGPTDVTSTEQQELWKAPVPTILEKLKNASVETLQKVKGYESARPAGARATLMKAVDVAIAKAAGVGVQAAVESLSQTVEGQ